MTLDGFTYEGDGGLSERNLMKLEEDFIMSRGVHTWILYKSVKVPLQYSRTHSRQLWFDNTSSLGSPRPLHSTSPGGLLSCIRFCILLRFHLTPFIYPLICH